MAKDPEEQRAHVKFARDIARQVIKKHACQVPIPVTSLAEYEGLQIEYELIALPAQFYRDENLIIVKKDEHRHRQRFSIAHELGHWFLHHNLAYDECTDQGEPFDAFRRIVEYEANEFAGELLMPLPEINHLLKNGVKPDDMAVASDVSRDALWVRLSRLGKIPGVKAPPY